MLPGFANHMVVGWLGGWGKALTAETLSKKTIGAIRDGPALDHAYEAFGGVPEVVLESSNDIVPLDLRERLGRMTRLPS